jgi:hypothetical protein
MILLPASVNQHFCKSHTQASNTHGTMASMGATQFKKNWIGFLAILACSLLGRQRMQHLNLAAFLITVP